MEALAIELRTLSDAEMQAVPSEATLVALASKIYSARRKVDEVFGMPGFAVSPAWDIVLDLFKAKSEGKTISVTSACIGAACPPTTALRWLQALESMNLIERKPDHQDGRRTVVELTEGGSVKVAKAVGNHL
jgi:predicted transcriptional regulator